MTYDNWLLTIDRFPARHGGASVRAKPGATAETQLRVIEPR